MVCGSGDVYMVVVEVCIVWRWRCLAVEQGSYRKDFWSIYSNCLFFRAVKELSYLDYNYNP